MTKGKVPLWLEELLEKNNYKQIKCNPWKEGKQEGDYLIVNEDNFTGHQIKRTVVLEGIPGGGKTTLCNFLSKKYNANQVDQIILKNFEDSEQYFMMNDEQKCELALNGPNRTSIMDRNFVSTLAYNYANKQIGLKNQFETVLKWYQKKIGRSLFVPDVYIFLNVSVPRSFKRKNRIPKKETDNPWLNERVIVEMNRFYDKYFKDSNNINSYYCVNTDNKDLESVIGEINNILTKEGII